MGGTYADQWNLHAANNGISLPSNPQLVVLSGEWDMHAETSDMMEFEVSLPELVAEALGDLRASNDFRNHEQDSGTVSMMDVDFGVSLSDALLGEMRGLKCGCLHNTASNGHLYQHYTGKRAFTVCCAHAEFSARQDTNVMISYLNIMDSLARLLHLSPDLSISVLIPGIVMSELDGLRKSMGRSCQHQAQAANRWAASELGKRSVVRGQRDNATTAPGGSWRRHYYATGKVHCPTFETSAPKLFALGKPRWVYSRLRLL